MGRTVNVEVIGVNPPCARCDVTWKNTEKAVAVVKAEGIDATMKKLDIVSKDVIQKYGALVSPALALNGVVKIMGRVPDPNEIVRLLREKAS
jgi:hypothetical protein